MGRQKNSSLKVKSFTVFPILLRKTSDDPERDYRGIVIRITDKKDISIDIECYDDSPDRIRVKTKPEFWINGKITGGYSEDTVNRFNRCLHRIQSEIVNYVNANATIKKPLLMQFLYGIEWANSKKKRTKYVTIPTTYQGRIIGSHDFTTKEIQELIQPLESKQQFKDANGNSKIVEGIFDPETGESMIEDAEDFYNIVLSEKADRESAAKTRADKERISKMSTEERYKNGLYNKQDIFEIFALTYFDDTITNEFYPKIVIRLFEYKERTNAPAHPRFYNKEWILNFFRWFETNGYYTINTKSFDPLKYDPKIFHLNKERKQYEGKSLQKMLNIIKDLSRKFYKRGLLPEVKELSEIKIKDFTKKKDRKGTRKEFSLSKDEFDTLFHHQILKKDLKKYQAIYNEINKANSPITIDELVTGKLMFICQVMFGGLRGWHDYKTCSIKNHSKGVKKVVFHVGKKDDAIENPLNAYTSAVLKETGGEIPFIDNEHKYRQLIKTVVKFIDFEKEIKKNKYKADYHSLAELFSPGYFARKTFAQILRANGVTPEEIQLFTGHEKEDNELKASYLDDNTIEFKSKLLKNLKIGKGL